MVQKSFTFWDLWSDFRQTEQRTVHKYRKQLDVIGDQLNYLSSPLHFIQETYEDDLILRDILMGQISKVSLSFQASLSNVVRALYGDSMGSIRNGMETAWLLLFLIDKPDQRERWAKNEQIWPSEVRKGLPFGDMRRELYDEMSNITHPNLASIQAYVSVPSGIKYGPFYDEFLTRWHLFNMHKWLGWVIEELYHRLYPTAFEKGIPIVPKFVYEYGEAIPNHKAIMAEIRPESIMRIGRCNSGTFCMTS